MKIIFVNSLDTRLKRISKLLDLVFIYILRNAPTSIGIEVFITVRKPAWGRQTLLGEHTDVTHDKICNDWDTTLYPWYFLPCLLEPSQMNVSLRDNPILSFLFFFNLKKSNWLTPRKARITSLKIVQDYYMSRKQSFETHWDHFLPRQQPHSFCTR